MSTRITVTLPDDIYSRAEYLARLTGRNVAELLTETIETSLLPLGSHHATEALASDLTDQEVLDLADGAMDPAQNQRFTVLLDKQQADLLDGTERQALMALMQIYQDGLLRKARAMREAVRRGLLPPLEA
jgi:predicted DNA-binding protein